MRVASRFWAKVDRSSGPESCWNWLAYLSPTGYGKFWDGERKVLAHRFSLSLVGIEVPDGMVTDHLCRNRGCVNPRHLRVVRQRTNLLENSENFVAVLAAKTHCLNGHELGGENLVVARNGGRRCRTCDRMRSRHWYRLNVDHARDYQRSYKARKQLLVVKGKPAAVVAELARLAAEDRRPS